MDIGLPRDGRLRGGPAAPPASPSWAEPLLVAVTGYAEDEARRRSREAGFDHHLVKPVDPEAILALLASLEWSEDPRAAAGSPRNCRAEAHQLSDHSPDSKLADPVRLAEPCYRPSLPDDGPRSS